MARGADQSRYTRFVVIEPPLDVSVIVPTRNRPALLEQAVRSALAQTLTRLEVIVVDDGSSPPDAEEYRRSAAQFGDRVRLLQPLSPGEIGSGPSISRNRGITAARGRYIAFLDDDDAWTLPSHLELAVESLAATGLELYCADLQGFRGDQLVVATWFPDKSSIRRGRRLRVTPDVFELTRHDFVEASRHRNLNPDPLVVARALIDRAGGYTPTLRFAEDFEFLMRLADHVDRVVFCDQVVARYRLPEAGSHSVSMARLEQHLQSLAAGQHLRMTARTAEVREVGRRLESWTLREISAELKQLGHRGAGLRTAVQAMAVRPTLGALTHVLRIGLG